MGVVVNESVALDVVLARAEVAVVVTLATPAMTSVAIPVPGSPTRSCGTYAYGAWEATVVEVLAAKPGAPALAVGERVTIFPANTGTLIELSSDACLHGGSKSPIFARFAGDDDPDGATRIALLDWDPPYGFTEAVSGAWLAPERRAEVALSPRASTALPPTSVEDALCLSDADCTWAPTSCDPCASCAPSAWTPAQTHAARAQLARCPPPGTSAVACPACERVARPVACVAMRCVAK